MPKSKKIPRKIIHQFVDLAHDETKIPELIAMLEAYPALLNTPRPGKDKETAMGAAIHGSGVSEKYIQFWLDQSVEMDAFIACKLSRYDELSAFLDADAQLIKAKAKYAHNMDLIDLVPDQKMVEFLLARGYPMTIHVAAKKGMVSEIERILDEDPGVVNEFDSPGMYGKQPLHNALVWGGEKTAELLVARGADVTQPCKMSIRPLGWACIKGHERIVRIMLELGERVDTPPDDYRASFLFCVIEFGSDDVETNLRIIRMLFEAGVDPSVRNVKDQTAYEAAEGSHECAELIRELSA